MNISSLVFIATAGIVMLISFLVIFILVHQRKMLLQDKLMSEKESDHQKELLNASLEIAEQERAKTAANIHDDLGMLLNVIKLNINKASRNIHDTSLALKLLDDNNDLIRKTIDMIRIISNDLMPSTLINVGFIEAMMDLCNHINELDVLELELKTELQHVELDSKDALQLYRLVKELLNNVIKHSKASRAEMEIRKQETNLQLIITHNGQGITTAAIRELAQSGKGAGLKNISGRAQLLHASVEYFAPADSAAGIIIIYPL
jgi:signal transduction histidine kinase